MTGIRVYEGESIDDALRRFKKQCERDGILQEIKRREFYKSPSVIRKEKLAESRRRGKRIRGQLHNKPGKSAKLRKF